MQLRRVSVALFSRAWLCLVVVGLVLLCGGTARAQVNTADLSGQVVDPKGLAVPGAKVTVENWATGASRTAETDDSGRYRFVVCRRAVTS